MIHKNEIFSMGQTTPKQNFFFAEQGGPWEWLYGAKWVMGGGGGGGEEWLYAHHIHVYSQAHYIVPCFSV